MGLPARGAVAAAVAGVLGAFAPGAPVTAEPPVSDQDERPPFSLTVSPTRIVVPPGLLDRTAEIRVRNNGRVPAEVVVGKRDMQASPEGRVRYVTDAPYSAMDWVTATPERFRLDAGESRLLTVRITLPGRYEPGDHHVAVMVVAQAGEAAGNIRVNRGIGVPVYVQAPGPVDRSVRLSRFEAPRFVISGPVEFTAELEHTGTVHRDFRGEDRLAIDTGGGSVELPEFALLRDARRVVTTRWEDPPMMCACEATLAIPRPGGGAELRSTTVYVVPVHLFAAVLVLLVAGVVVLVHRHRRGVRRR